MKLFTFRTIGNIVEETDTESVIELESNSMASTYCFEELTSSSEPSRKRQKPMKNQEVHEDFREFLKTATEAISVVRTAEKCEISLYFETMSEKIKNANLPRGVWNKLEHEISSLVYKELQKHQ